MEYENILTSLDNGVFTITINRPEIAMSVLQKLLILSRVHEQQEVLETIEARFDEIESKYLQSPLSQKARS